MMKTLLRVLASLGIVWCFSPVQARGNMPDVRENGWGYPVDYRVQENCYQFLQYAGHVGVDLCRPSGITDVSAIADGCVEKFDTALGYYGGTSGQEGGAVLLRHRTSSGRFFFAVYGHVAPKESYLNDRKCNGGTTFVAKGDIIATVNPYIGGTDHLHFGIRPDEVEEKEPYRGKGCSKPDNCGWVDPFPFLMEYEPGASGLDPSTVPGNTLNVLRVGNYGWYPSDVSCINATHWYGLDSSGKIMCSYSSGFICYDIFEDAGQFQNWDLFFGSGRPSCHN